MQTNLATALVSTGIQKVVFDSIQNDESLKNFTETFVGPELGRGATLLLSKARTEIESRTGITDKSKKLFKAIQKHYAEKTPEFVKNLIDVPCAVVDGLIIAPSEFVLSWIAPQGVTKFIEREGGKFIVKSALNLILPDKETTIG